MHHKPFVGRLHPDLPGQLTTFPQNPKLDLREGTMGQGRATKISKGKRGRAWKWMDGKWERRDGEKKEARYRVGS